MKNNNGKRILIVGASGSFGERIRRHIVQFSDADAFAGVELWLTSRNQESVQSMVEETQKWVQNADKDIPIHGVVLDITKNLNEKMRAIKPFAVLDLSGPFQFASYQLAEAALKVGAHILDLADARDYLMGYAPALDDLARKNGVMALSGASSTPALSYSVVQHMVSEWQAVHNIAIAIMPGGKSKVGAAVLKAVLSYCGRPVAIWRNGKLDTARGWKHDKSFTLPNLRKRRCSYVDTVDAELMGRDFKVKDSAGFYAGLESQLEQISIEAMSKITAMVKKYLNVQLNLTRLEPILSLGRHLTHPFNSASGGMVVAVDGFDDAGKAIARQWSLVAHSDHGPSIPIMAMAAGLKKLLQTDVTNPRACMAHEYLTMDEILTQTKAYDISWQMDEGEI